MLAACLIGSAKWERRKIDRKKTSRTSWGRNSHCVTKRSSLLHRQCSHLPFSSICFTSPSKSWKCKMREGRIGGWREGNKQTEWIKQMNMQMFCYETNRVKPTDVGGSTGSGYTDAWGFLIRLPCTRSHFFLICLLISPHHPFETMYLIPHLSFHLSPCCDSLSLTTLSFFLPLGSYRSDLFSLVFSSSS